MENQARKTRTAKMRIRLIFLTEVVLFSCALLVFANKSLAQSPEEKLQRLSQVLGLSPQQKSQLLPVLQAEAPKLQAIKSNPSLSNATRKKSSKPSTIRPTLRSKPSCHRRSTSNGRKSASKR